MNKEIEARKNVAVKACKQVGGILISSFGRKVTVTSKGDRDLVTNIDKQVEKTIISLIKKHFPQDGIVSEESPDAPTRSGFRWIIDPIDGTHNFIHNIEIFGTSVALEFKGEVLLGIINMPWSDELYIAQRGKGAYRNGRKISVSKKKMEEATMIYDSSIRMHKNKMLKGLGRLTDKVFNVRMFGSTVRSLTYVAEGKAEMEIEFCDKVWDFAAGLLLVEEAQGKATDFSGRPWNIHTRGYIASNGIVHQGVLDVIKSLRPR
ncbi:MAG: inositol monophosphatase [Candidatus Omnitrophica bacterium]|nr:inositol monophosphatase [Candidatus Omnitrophota bacterium]